MEKSMNGKGRFLDCSGLGKVKIRGVSSPIRYGSGSLSGQVCRNTEFCFQPGMQKHSTKWGNELAAGG